jgi:flagellar biosynthesis protein FliQ
MSSGAVARQGGGLAKWITAEAPITGETLRMFAAMNLFVSAVVGGLVVSVLQTGETLQKLQLVPLFAGFTVGAFLIGSFLLNSMILSTFAL